MPCHLRDGIAVLLAFLTLQAAPSPPGSEIVGAPAAPFCRLGEGPPPNLKCDAIPCREVRAGGSNPNRLDRKRGVIGCER